MMECVICGCTLGESNKSNEHIIPNAIGGVLQYDGIYCKSCNGRLGLKTDKDFISIFAPIVDRIDIHKSRNTRGSSYTGAVLDNEGNILSATFCDKKVMKMYDSNNNFIKFDQGKHIPLYVDFKMNNIAFKKGLSKIAFNYAISKGIPPQLLDGVFDFKTKTFKETAYIIPFVPLSTFDRLMESKPTSRIYHSIRIFNINDVLYSYIDLFNTFQYYVVLSTHYGLDNIDEGVVNIIDSNDKPDDKLLVDLTPHDYKDMDIIATQYQININDVINNLKKYHDYNNMDTSNQWNELSRTVGKKAYDICRKQTYIRDYNSMINEQYDSIEWNEEFDKHNNKSLLFEFYSSFEFYTIYEENCVNISRYKKYHTSGQAYPVLIAGILENSLTFPKKYCTYKFNMLP